jgi:hypothetical protein
LPRLPRSTWFHVVTTRRTPYFYPESFSGPDRADESTAGLLCRRALPLTLTPSLSVILSPVRLWRIVEVYHVPRGVSVVAFRLVGSPFPVAAPGFVGLDARVRRGYPADPPAVSPLLVAAPQCSSGRPWPPCRCGARRRRFRRNLWPFLPTSATTKE